MTQILKKNGLTLFSTFLGIIAGYLHWRLVGCQTGACPITSHWYTSVIFGGLAGYLIGDIIKDIRKKRANESTVE